SEPVQPGDYDLIVAKLGYQPANQKVHLEGQVRREITLAKMMSRPRDGSGSHRLLLLVREAGQPKVVPIAGAELTITRSGRAVTQPGPTVTKGQTGATGRYQVDLPPGTYTVTVKQGPISTSLDVTIGERDVSREIELDKQGGTLKQRPKTGGTLPNKPLP